MNKYFKLLTVLFLTTINANAMDELQIKSESTYLPSYSNRYSFLLGVNPSLPKFSDVTNLTFSYGKKLDDYWLDSNILLTNGVFNKITANNAAATTLTDDQLVGTKSTLITFGVGIGSESQYFQTLLPFENIYETIAADVTYNSFKEKNSTLSFTGFGMLAKFALSKKFSNYYSVGTQFTYNLAVVKRSANYDSESSSARSLTMSNLTVGLDLSFFL